MFRGLSSQARTVFPARLPRRVRPGGGEVALHEFVAIEERKRTLLRTRMAMPYQLQKCATWKHFQRFLRRVPGQPTEMSCTPDHVISYLISSDPNGRTVVHSSECRRQLSPPCSCPVRLAFKTVDSTIGRLRSAFRDLLVWVARNKTTLLPRVS